MNKPFDQSERETRTPWWSSTEPETHLHVVEEVGDDFVAWQVGDVLEGGYEVVEVRKGGMGVVYTVYDPTWVRNRAFKTYRPDLFSPERGQAALEREAQAWIRLPYHPHVVTANFFTTLGGVPCIQMDYVWGRSLDDCILLKGQFGIVDLLELAVEVCSAMIHLSRHGVVVHRDLSPRNILITAQGRAKITDFGTARAFRVGGKRAIVGATLPYMAPEQFQGQEDTRSDVYSFGIILYQALTGQIPFSGRQPEDYMRQHHEGPLPSVRSLRRNTPSMLDYIVHRCASKRPSDRYGDFQELMTDVARLLGRLTGQPVVVHPTGEADHDPGKAVTLMGMGLYGEGARFLAPFHREIREAGIAPNDTAGLFKHIVGKAEQCHQHGRQCLETGDYETALDYFLRALQIVAPVDFEMWASQGHQVDNDWKAAVWLDKGKAHAALGQTRLARESCARAVQFDPRLSESAEQALQSPPRAEEIRRTAREYDPDGLDQAEESFYQGRVLAEQGDHAGAIEHYREALALAPEHVLAEIEIGISLNEIGEHSEAVQHFDAALARDPENAATLLDKGFSLEKLERYAEAVQCYDRILAADPDSHLALQNKGYALLLSNDHEAALACFERVSQLAPGLMLAQHGILRAAVALNDSERAVSACRRLMEGNEPIEDAEAFRVIDWMFKSKQYFDAMELFTYFILGGQMERFIYEGKDALNWQWIEGMLRMLIQHGSRCEPFARLARLAHMAVPVESILSMWKEPLEWNDGTVRLKPTGDNHPETPLIGQLVSSEHDLRLEELEERAAEVLSQRAQQPHSQGEVQKQSKQLLEEPQAMTRLAAIKDRYRKAWNLVFEAACNLARLPLTEPAELTEEGIGLGMQERFPEAVERFVRALQLNAFRSSAYNALGVALKRMDLPHLAVLSYEEALLVSYFDEVGHHNLGLAFMELDRLDDAIAHFEESLRLAPKSDTANLDIALERKRSACTTRQATQESPATYSDLVAKGQECIQKRSWKEAERALKRAADLEPERPEPHLTLGLMYQALGRYRQAVASLEHHLTLTRTASQRPSNREIAGVYHAMGLCYGHMGLGANEKALVDKAIEMFQRAISLDPTDASNHHLLGGLYYRQGRHDEAIECLLKAVEVEPGLDEAHGELGLAYMETGQVEKAIQEFETALELKPDDTAHQQNLHAAKSLHNTK